MKISTLIQPRRALVHASIRGVVFLAACIAGTAALAANYYADFNGNTAGFGTPVSGDADSATIWNTNSLGAGTGALVAFPSSASAFYTFGTTPGDTSLQGTFLLSLTSGDAFDGITVNSTGLNITMNGTGNNHGVTANWYINAGSTLTMSSTRQAPGGLNYNKTVVTFLGGGTYNFGTAIGPNDSIAGSGFIENMTNGTVNIYETNLSVTYVSTYVGNYTLANGTLNFASPQSAGSFSGFLAASNSVFAINGGTIDNTSGGSIVLGMGSGTISLGGNFNFTGSTNLDFSGAPVVLTGNRVVNVAASTLSIGGAISGAGFGLTKVGAGALDLYGSSTFTGGTTVGAGTLLLTGAGSLSASSPLSISSATLDISGMNTPYLNTPSLSLTNSTLVVPVLSTPALTNVVAANLNLGGTTNVINIASIPLTATYPSQYPLIQFTTLTGGFNIGLGTLPAAATPYVGYITNIGNFVYLELVSGPPPVQLLTWTGTDPSNPNNWDVGTSVNWKNNVGAAATYNQLDYVTFNDTATGSTNIYVSTTLTPGSLVVSNNVLPYSFSGSGPISGTTGLTKQGSGTLLVDEGNTYTGPTTISGGTVRVGNSDDNGTLGYGSIVNNGSLIFDYPGNSSVVTNNIYGTGSVTEQGGDTLVLAGANTFTGGTLVMTNPVYGGASTLELGSYAALGSNGVTTVANGATLDVYGYTAGGIVMAQGSGVNGVGAINNSSSVIAGYATPAGLSYVGLTNLTMTGNTTIGTTGARWDLRSPGGSTGSPTTATLSTGGHPYNLTKIGNSGTVGFFGIVSATVDPMLANIDIQAGTLAMQGNTTSLGNPTNTLTVEQNATFQIYAETNQLNKVVVVDDNATLNNASGADTIVGPVILTNVDGSSSPDSFFDIAGTSLTLTGPVTGSSVIYTTVGTGLLVLSGNSPAYTGGIYINDGTVQLTGTLNNTAGVYANYGTFILDGLLTGGGITNASLGVVCGTGTNSGSLDAYGTVFAGNSTNAVGTLTMLGDMIVEGPAILDFSLSPTNTVGGSNDLIAVNGNLTLNGGTININPHGLLMTAGASYPLMTYSGSLTANALPYVVPVGGYNFTVDVSVPNQVRVDVTGGPAVWNGGSTSDNNWSDSANWNGVTVTSGPLIFAGTTRLNNTNDTSAGTSYGDLDFLSGSGAFVLNGNELNLIGNINNLSSSNQTINIPMTFEQNTIINAGTAGVTLTGGLTNTATANLTIQLQGTNGVLAESLQGTTPGATQNLGVTVASTTGTNSWSFVGNNSSYMTNLTIAAGILNIGTGADAPLVAVSNSVSTLTALSVGTVTNGTGVGVLNMNSGTLFATCPGDDAIDVGNVTNGHGIFNMNGGSLIMSGKYFIIGGFTGSGVYNQTGGSVTAYLTDVICGNAINTSTGTVSIAGGTFDATGAGYTVAFRGAGILNLSGTGLLKVTTFGMTRNSSDSANATAIANLNGGTLQMNAESFGNAATNQTAFINFNGTHVVATTNSTSFFSVPTLPSVLTTTVRTNGAIIDDGGFAITISTPLLHDSSIGTTPDGGLVKLGAGTLTLSAASTYTGGTVVSNGTLAVNGTLASPAVSVDPNATLAGSGSVGGKVTVAAGGTIAPGGAATIGTLTVVSNAVLQGAAVLGVNATTNDTLVANTVTFGGALTVTNISGGSLSGSVTYPLFKAGSYSGNFTATNLPALGSGQSWNWNPANGTLSLISTVLVPSVPPAITSFSFAGNNIVINGTNAQAGGTYYLLSTTNVALPRNQWTAVATNVVSTANAFTFTGTNVATPGVGQEYFMLSSTNN